MKCINIVLLLSFLINSGQGALTELECPLPGGRESASEDICNSYTGCGWSGGECFLKEEVSYEAVSDPETTENGFKLELQKHDSSITLFDDDVYQIMLQVIQHENNHLQIKIYDPSHPRYEVPLPIQLPAVSGEAPLYEVVTSDLHESFQLSVVRKDTGTNIFQTVGPLIFEDQFIQLTTSLPSEHLYGLGENMHSSLQHVFDPPRTYPIFPRDQPVSPEEINNYGHHPYYVVIEDDDGHTHSVLMRTSNAMEYMTSMLYGNPSLTLRTIGGIIDLHFFLGPTPEEVNMQYNIMIGRPNFPPYWSLGFHLSRYGYANVEEVRDIRERMKAEGIPQDIQTFDIDYMMKFKDFTYDEETWQGLPDLLQELHNDNVRTTLILDPALVIELADYLPAQRGKDNDVYIKWSQQDYIPEDQPPEALDYMVGYVWPFNKTVFPDFFKPETIEWWGNELEILHQTLPFDSIWVDMNEPANFGTNLDKPWNYPDSLPSWSLKCPYNRWDSPPYPTKASYMVQNECKRLSDKTICMSGLQTDGNNSYLHYDVHSLYGWSESVATYKGLEKLFPGKRQVVLSRSTYTGSGTYAVHWLGDNFSNWEQMRLSIIGMIEFNLFGIPMVGADVCGFIGDTTEELCARWMQLGAFSPFNRNHNSINQIAQDPTAWPLVIEASRYALNIRYGFLPYLYLLFYNARVFGQSVLRPMWNVFPSDPQTYTIQDQFMWGTGILVAPIVYEGANERDVYFPKGNWYDIETGHLVSDHSQTLSISAPIPKIPVYLNEGTIFPYQIPALTTDESRKNPFKLIAALNDDQTAQGQIFWDDGETVLEANEFFFANTKFSQNEFIMNVGGSMEPVENLYLEQLICYGLTTAPTEIQVNDVVTDTWSYDDMVLSIDLQEPLGEYLVISISY